MSQPLPEHDDPDLVRLTDAQRRLLLQHRLYPGDGSLNLAYAFAITGPLDRDRLIRCARRVVAGCRGLNTTFPVGHGDQALRQPAHPRSAVMVTRLADTGSAEAEERLVADGLSARADQPIPPDRRPLYEIEVLLGRHATYLTMLVSHLVADAYTAYNLIEACGALYAERRSERELADNLLDDPATTQPVRPADPSAAIEVFRHLLREVSSLGHEVLTVARPATGLRGEHAVVDLPVDVVAGLQAEALIGRHGPFAVFLATHAVLLSALARRRHVVVGVPLGNRRSARQRRAFGYFVNTVPLAVDVDPDLGFGDLVAQVSTSVFTLLRHQSFDFAAHADSVLGGTPSGPVSVDNTFTFYKRELRPDLPGCEVRPLAVQRSSIAYPLSVNVEQRPDGYRLRLEYLSELTAADPAQAFGRLLRAVAVDPSVRVGELCIADPPAADAGVEHPTPESLDAWFHQVASERGDAVAVSDDTGSLTYADLDAAASRVAAHLLGLGAREAVAIAMRRDRRLLPVILGTLRAGLTYVPVDPSAPSERARRIVAQFDDLVLVAEPGLLPGVDVRRVDPDTLLNSPAADAPPPAPTADSVAYVIFTSGSTGLPKGVEVTHRNVMRLFIAAEEHYDFGAGDVWCLFHSYAFDFSVWEIFGALLFGGRLVVVPELSVRSPRAFADLLRREGVTVLNQTPSAFRRLTAVLEPGELPTVRWIVFGGEALRFDAVRPWFERQGTGARLVNMYGITETTVHVTFCEVTPELARVERESVIGAPLSDLTLAVVDQNLNPTPVGIPGELLVGGAGLARGYRRAPELTAGRFLRGTRYGDVVYRTGDLVRVRSDQALVYLGRIDHQVQLRGYRIELGEIECALASMPGVADSVVRLDEPDGLEPRLVAYVVGELPPDAALRDALAQRLPAYMVPSVFVRLDKIPLTVNGKVAVDQLPAPPRHAPVAWLDSCSDALAVAIARIWEETVQAGAVGPDDSFFDVGGTSMHVAEVHRRLVAELGADDLAMVELFEHPTPAALAARIRSTQRDRRPARPARPARVPPLRSADE